MQVFQGPVLTLSGIHVAFCRPTMGIHCAGVPEPFHQNKRLRTFISIIAVGKNTTGGLQIWQSPLHYIKQG